jgi:hypothetical protein
MAGLIRHRDSLFVSIFRLSLSLLRAPYPYPYPYPFQVQCHASLAFGLWWACCPLSKICECRMLHVFTWNTCCLYHFDPTIPNLIKNLSLNSDVIVASSILTIEGVGFHQQPLYGYWCAFFRSLVVRILNNSDAD